MENGQQITVEEAIKNKIQVLREFEIVRPENKKEIEQILRDAIANHPGRDIEVVLDQAAYDIIQERMDFTLEENPNGGIKVMVVETGKVYKSIRKCALYLGLNRKYIQKCLNGELPHYKGYHFKYVD